VSGLFAAVAALMLSVEQSQIVSTFGLQETIYVLAGVVLGGLRRPIPATLGGFTIGFAIGILGGVLPSSQTQYLPSFIFAAVIVVLLVRPNGVFTRGGGAVERV
jgi:branched-chain amino acid transport system permease protein